MKKSVPCISLLLILSLLLSGCGASASKAAADATMNMALDGGDYDMAATQEEDAIWDTEAEYPMEPESEPNPEPEAGAGLLAGTGLSGSDLAEKIIYSASADLETLDFDASVQTLYDLMDQYGAFLENSSLHDSQLLYDDGYRSGSFTLRVPQAHYADLTGALDQVGHVIYLGSFADNITAQYTDTQSRLAAYETEEQRLLEIMAQAETVEDLISLESRLSEIRYQKESLTSQLQNWDNQVSYSTVTLSLQEVRDLTPEPEEERTYWQQVGDGFLATIHWMGRAGKTLFRVFVAALPILLPLAVIILVVVLLCLRKKRQTKRRQAEARSAKSPDGGSDT